MKSALLIPFLGGCTAASTISGFHTVYNDCGPDNQLIISIDMGLADPDCQVTAVENGLMRLSIYAENIQFGELHTIGEDMSAVWCIDDNCVDVPSGTLEVTALEEGIAVSGYYEFTLVDGSAFAGDLAAEWCGLEQFICE